MINDKLVIELQEQIDELKSVVLYSNTTGGTETFSCSENISNFRYLQFDFQHQHYRSSAIAPVIDGTLEITSIGIPEVNQTVQIVVDRFTYNENTITFVNEGMVNFTNKTISWESISDEVQSIKINRIIGFK